MMTHYFWTQWTVTGILLLIFFPALSADDTLSLVINDDIEIEILHLGKPSPVAIIWFNCQQGDETAEFNSARVLTGQGYQFYFPDMLSAHFLAPTQSNIARVPAAEVSQVIHYILGETESEQVYLIGAARSAIPVLKALADPSLKNTKLKGALLITPRINHKTPEPGTEPEYIKEAGMSTLPIRVLEGERTPNRWGLPHLASVLSTSGSPVHTDIIPGVRGFFYLRQEKTAEESALTEQLDQLIHTNIQKLGTIKP